MAIPGLKNNKCKPCSNIDVFGCPDDACPDFNIRRNDSHPHLKLSIETCDGAIDFSDESIIVEVNMWAYTSASYDIKVIDDKIKFKNNIGFFQVNVGDIIIVDHIRNPEHMLVTCINEDDFSINVSRGYHGTNPKFIKKNTSLRIFKLIDAPAEIDITYGSVLQKDGVYLDDQLLNTSLVYKWKPGDTCFPGCYYLEFKVFKMNDSSVSESSPSYPSQISTCSSITTHLCGFGNSIEWIRRFPVAKEGLLVKIEHSPTTEI